MICQTVIVISYANVNVVSVTYDNLYSPIENEKTNSHMNNQFRTCPAKNMVYQIGYYISIALSLLLIPSWAVEFRIHHRVASDNRELYVWDLIDLLVDLPHTLKLLLAAEALENRAIDHLGYVSNFMVFITRFMTNLNLKSKV